LLAPKAGATARTTNTVARQIVLMTDLLVRKLG